MKSFESIAKSLPNDEKWSLLTVLITRQAHHEITVDQPTIEEVCEEFFDCDLEGIVKISGMTLGELNSLTAEQTLSFAEALIKELKA